MLLNAPSSNCWRISNNNTEKSIESQFRFKAKQKKTWHQRRNCTAVPVTMEARNRQDGKSVFIKRRHGALSAGEAFAEELCLKAIVFLYVATGEEENEEEESQLPVAATLSKINAGGWLCRAGGYRCAPFLCLVGKAGYVYLPSLLRACFHVFEIRRAPLMNKNRNVSTMTTADSAVCIFCLDTSIFSLGVFHLGLCA